MMSNNTLLIKGGTVVPMTGRAIINKGAVFVQDGVIEGVFEEGLPLPRCRHVVDATNCLVMPGLVNSHCHSPMSLFRGMADDLSLDDWLQGYILPAESRFINPETVHTGALLSCAEMLLSGTTCFCDSYFFENEVAEAVMKIGIRAVLGHSVADKLAGGDTNKERTLAKAVDFVQRWKNRTPWITPSIFCHSTYACSWEILSEAKEEASRQGVLFQIHLAETRGEVDQIKSKQGLTSCALLDERDIIDNDTLLIHGVWLTDSDLDIIANRGAAISHNPGSNMKLASGVAPVPSMLKRGIPVGLGTDSPASNNNLDMFGEMQAAAKLHKVHTLDPTEMDVWTVLEMATVKGAKAIGMGAVVGQLQKGMQADIIIIDTAKPHLSPMYNPASHLVYAAAGPDVRDVFVGGRQVVKNGRLITFDANRIIDSIGCISTEIKNRMKQDEWTPGTPD